MKKIFIISFLISTILLCYFSTTYAATPTLSEIVDKFNNSSIVDTYKNAGGSISATNDINSINVKINADGTTANIELILEGNILFIEIDQEDSSALVKAYVTAHIIDIIGQLHGYQEGELLQTINSDKSQNYTLEKEGYEIENISGTNKIKIDIAKKIPLVDFSNTYIEISDLEFLKEYIFGDGSATKSKGDIYFHKSGYDGQYTLIVAEKNELTENTYKSILSLLEVMFDSKEAVNYFKNNFSNLSVGNKDFKGFKIELNPQKDEWEETLLGSDNTYKFIRLTIDKNTTTDLLNISNDNDKPLNTMNHTSNNLQENVTQITNSINKLPQTGKTFEITDALYLLCIVSSIALIAIILKSVKYKKI